MWHAFRQRCATVLDASHHQDRLSRSINIFLISLIVINVAAVILESVASLRAQWGPVFSAIETFSVLIFTIEYLVRVWSIVDNPWQSRYHLPIRGRLRFMRSPMAIIDLLAILPYWLSMFFALDLRFLRVARLLRVLKLTRYSGAMNLLFEVLREEAKVLGAALFALSIILILTASAAYLAENHAQPEAFANIPQAMWWAIVTVTTVGYGDISPITPIGKILGAFLALVGVGMVAIPAGILASGFSNALQRRRKQLERDMQSALSDGVIDQQERQQIEQRGESLSLSEKTVDDLLSHPNAASMSICPHCGKPIEVKQQE